MKTIGENKIMEKKDSKRFTKKKQYSQNFTRCLKSLPKCLVKGKHTETCMYSNVVKLSEKKVQHKSFPNDLLS